MIAVTGSDMEQDTYIKGLGETKPFFFSLLLL